MSNEPAKQLKNTIRQTRETYNSYVFNRKVSDTQRCEVRIKDRVVPILFVPGIHGSN